MEGLGASEIKDIVNKAQNNADWTLNGLKEHLKKNDINHNFYKNGKKLSYTEVENITRKDFDNIYFKLYEKNKVEILFYNREYNSIVVVDIGRLKNNSQVKLSEKFTIKTLFSKRIEDYFKKDIRVDSKKGYRYLNIGNYPLKKYVHEALDFLKDLKEDTHHGEIEHVTLWLNGGKRQIS